MKQGRSFHPGMAETGRGGKRRQPNKTRNEKLFAASTEAVRFASGSEDTGAMATQLHAPPQERSYEF